MYTVQTSVKKQRGTSEIKWVQLVTFYLAMLHFVNKMLYVLKIYAVFFNYFITHLAPYSCRYFVYIGITQLILQSVKFFHAFSSMFSKPFISFQKHSLCCSGVLLYFILYLPSPCDAEHGISWRYEARHLIHMNYIQTNKHIYKRFTLRAAARWWVNPETISLKWYCTFGKWGNWRQN